MAKRRKKKKPSSSAPKLTPQKYIRTKARKLPFYKCIISEDWENSGMAMVMIARQQGGEKLVVGMYLLDTWCLGLKDTHYQFRMDNYEFENDFLPRIYQDRDVVPVEVDANFAQNLVYGAIEYAEDLGIAPHKDFALTEYILDPADSLEMIDFEFGKDGLPHYIAGPHDNVEMIVNTLARNVGMDNFHYTIPWMNDLDYGYDYENEYEDDDEEDNEEGFAEDIEFKEV